MVKVDNNKKPETYFAPAGRASQEDIELQKKGAEDPLLQAMLESVGGYIAILNQQRQILTCNNQLLQDLGLTNNFVVGKRPGEVVNCDKSKLGPDGCGTAEACSQCGAVLSILSCQNGKPEPKECILTSEDNGVQTAHEFRAKATPVKIGTHDFIAFTLQDIQAEKRRDLLERTFFHDILNTVSGIHSWGYLLRDFDDEDPKEAADRIMCLALQVSDEINSFRSIISAEKGELTLDVSETSVASMFEQLEKLYKGNIQFEGVGLTFAIENSKENITTDKTLLLRVLGNMIKNALEASAEGQLVTVVAEKKESGHRFTVNNQTEIPRKTASQIFKRSFSTKGQPGRGIGTYSMKLLGEKYLGGKVGFTTSAEEGTTFFIEVPEK
ncbi:MAG: HAMP domain-containing histidine kinase [Fibrobacteria bacterium]|nr:HAMP domain-containing histidine kinase [Fibrobacteria bacterium]